MEYKKISIKDASKLSLLIKEMKDNLTNKSWFLPMESDIESVKEMINKTRFYILGAFDGENLAGIASLDYKNGKMPEKYPFPSWCDVSKMVEFSFCIVGVKYRGKGLMYEMLKKIREIAISQKYEFACCTVHNDNYPSKKNLLKIGFKYYMSVEQGSNYPRDILLMRLV